MRTNWIDGAKGIAMLMVIAVHFAQSFSFLPMKVFSFGAMGVQLFFIVSGYCLCMKINKEGGGSIIGRYRRLIPWYVAGMLTYATWYWAVGDSVALANYTIVNVVANALMVNTFLPSAQNTIVPGGWSISCIALFSFLFPFSLSATRQVRFKMLFSVACLGLFITTIGYLLLGWSRQYSYCSLFNQFIVFSIGVAYFEIRPRLLKEFKNCFLAFVSIIMFLLAVLCVAIDKGNSILYRHILISGCFCCILLLLERGEKFIPFWLLWIGRHSYEIFILHFAVIWSVERMFT
jgi:peptidoglycan/LPS O-acetylase OafA/YrhL